MGFKDCYKYESKAKDYEKEIDQLRERINDLWSVPKNPKTDQQIAKLEFKRSQLETKRVQALDEFNRCMSSGSDDYHDKH